VTPNSSSETKTKKELSKITHRRQHSMAVQEPAQTESWADDVVPNIRERGQLHSVSQARKIA
jgi:hypothetical protein